MSQIQPVLAPAKALANIAKIRSEVFQTLYNPECTRTGNKYLQRRLRGPSIINYYPAKVSHKALNAQTPYNRFANWEGRNEIQFKRDAIERFASSGQEEKWGSAMIADIEAAQKKRDAEAAAEEQAKKAGEAGESSEAESSTSVTANAESSSSSTPASTTEAPPTMAWKSSGQQLLSRDDILGKGFSEVERIPGAGWLDNAAERLRLQEVEVRRFMGKGPPKKGEGKRSQMKKKK